MTRLSAHTLEANQRLGHLYDLHAVYVLRKGLANQRQALMWWTFWLIAQTVVASGV